MSYKFKRILLKLSGEALAGGKSFGFDDDTVLKICKSIKKCVDLGVQVGIVVGGGNIFRGRSSTQSNKTRADHMGMLATVINALAVADTLEGLGISVVVQTAISMEKIAEPCVRDAAVRHLEKGRVVIFGCGTGNPFFSTDTAAALRAAEIGADVIMKATMVDGVYDSDPKENANAKRYEWLSFDQMLEKDLKVLDTTASALCKATGLSIMVFDIADPDNIVAAVKGEKVGTLLSKDKCID